MKQANCSAQEAIAFEDSLTGAQAAATAGIFTVLIPDHSFSDVEQTCPHYQYAKNLSVVRDMLKQLDK